MDDDPQWPARSWLTGTELAAMGGVSNITISREIARGHLAGERASGFIIEATEARRWLAAFSKWASQKGRGASAPS